MGPIADVDELSIDVTIGFPLALDEDSATELFDANPSGASAFQSSLLPQLTSHLEKASIRVTKTQDRVLTVSIYGGHFAKSGCDRNFYLVQVGLARAEEPYSGPDRTILGTATDADLSQSLLTTVLAVVDEFIEQRSRYRAIQNQPDQR
jgi:hypothetical protein